MIKIVKWSSYLLFLLVVTFLTTSCRKNDTTDNNSIQSQINILPFEALSSSEVSSLLFMREEEKLARDVYISMYNKWGTTIFDNISNSEQTHMDLVLLLLNKYGLTDPVTSNPVGVFNNTSLQNLYTQLVTQGNTSKLEAYRVGATIEDLDIFDLKQAIAIVDNQDIRLVFDNLIKGSRNHLRSFYKNVINSGGTYIPLYITQTEFDAIINSPMETGF